MKSVTVEKIGVDIKDDQAVVFLREPESNLVLPIWIGMQEATAIALRLQGQQALRPLTSDLLKNVLDTFDAKVLMVVINDMRDGVFHARIFLRSPSSASTAELDARPSDAIALALRCGAPIYVADWIIEEAGAEERGADEDDSDEDDSEEDSRQH